MFVGDLSTDGIRTATTLEPLIIMQAVEMMSCN